MRKQANRINFNQAEEEFLDGDETVGLGVLGAKGQVLHCYPVLNLLPFVDLSQPLHCCLPHLTRIEPEPSSRALPSCCRWTLKQSASRQCAGCVSASGDKVLDSDVTQPRPGSTALMK